MKIFTFLLLFAYAAAANADTFGSRLEKFKNRLPSEPKMRQQIDPIIKKAKTICSQPLIRRSRTLDEVLNGRKGARKISAHGRTALLVKEKKMKLAEIFGLGLSDVTAARLLYKELPLVAAAYRITGDKKMLDYLLKQLDEIASWRPIQRTGWTINMRTKSHSGRRSGVWLGTGFTIIGALVAIDMLPPDSLPPALKKKIDDWLLYEVKLITSDWKNKVPWYVKKQASQSNQWVVPSAGLLCAASYLGKDRVPEEYAQGLKNILASMSKMGNDGASSEGFAYATGWTVPALYTCAYFLQEKGDDSLASKPFFKAFPLWLAAHYQPGKNIINCFDYWGGCRNMYDRYMLDNIAALAAISDSPYLQWIVFNQHTRIPVNGYGLLCCAMPPRRMKEPPLYNNFKRGRLLTWRSSWQDYASGLWMRGRDPEDFHAHFDCGHINYIKNGKIMLLEAATTGYSDKRMTYDYKSLRGHNVLQIGNDILNNKKPYEAPFKIAKLDKSGGNVTIDATKSYDKAAKYTRQVVWNAGQLTATDNVSLKNADTITLRWHLGSNVKPQIKKTADGWNITVAPGKEVLPGWYGDFYPEWGKKPEKDIYESAGMTITITADQPVTVTAGTQVDHTIKYRKRYHEHNVIYVKTPQPVKTLKTTFSIK
jgi:hypothetical protein